MARSSSNGTRAPSKRHLEECSRSHGELIDQLYGAWWTAPRKGQIAGCFNRRKKTLLLLIPNFSSVLRNRTVYIETTACAGLLTVKPLTNQPPSSRTAIINHLRVYTERLTTSPCDTLYFAWGISNWFHTVKVWLSFMDVLSKNLLYLQRSQWAFQVHMVLITAVPITLLMPQLSGDSDRTVHYVHKGSPMYYFQLEMEIIHFCFNISL